jgi:predicted nucleic acid-binding protein
VTLLVDTGVFPAYADTNDQDHERCLSLLDGVTDDLQRHTRSCVDILAADRYRPRINPGHMSVQ